MDTVDLSELPTEDHPGRRDEARGMGWSRRDDEDGGDLLH